MKFKGQTYEMLFV